MPPADDKTMANSAPLTKPEKYTIDNNHDSQKFSTSSTNKDAVAAARTDTMQSITSSPSTSSKPPLPEYTFSPNDPSNPRNWPKWRKWSIVLIIIPVDQTVSWLASGYSPAETQVEAYFNISSIVATLGLSLYVLGLALGPMLMAPLSEYFSRNAIYIGGYGLCLLFVMGTALAPNIGGFLALRFISAICASITIANFGGTIADLWERKNTGYAMSLFLWAATSGSPYGYFLMSFVAANRSWRDVFWALLGICGGLWILMIIVLGPQETRHTTILRRRARKELKNLQKRAGEKGVDLKSEISEDDPRFRILQHRSLRDLIITALSRPFRFLFTEAIIIFGALFNGYLYGLSFLFNTAFSLVFGPMGHGFGTIQVGLTFLGIAFGITLGPITNLWQEKYYQRKTRGKNIPEYRVQLGQVAVCVQPIALFWFAWTSFKTIHFIVPIIASFFWGWSFYTLILMTYMYTEDSYGTFSASALAGLGLIRNLAGAGFPLFARAMYTNLGFEWASSLLGFLSLLLIPIPFVLARYGRKLRERSPWARLHMNNDDDEDGNEKESKAVV